MKPTEMSPSEQLAFSTVRIECQTPEGLSTGTGFYFHFCQPGEQAYPAIVTNKHVVKNATVGRLQIHLNSERDSLSPQSTSIDFADFQNHWIDHPDPDIDLCVMPFTHLLCFCENQGIRLFYKAMNADFLPSAEDLRQLMAIEDVVMIGYPNGLWDHVNNFPLFRKGITATHPNSDFCGKKEFMIDAAIFPGSSGSPVLLFNFGIYTNRQGVLIFGNRVKLLGILYAGTQHTAEGEIVIMNVPTSAKAVPIMTIPNNLGVVIKSEKLREFEPILKSLG